MATLTPKSFSITTQPTLASTPRKGVAPTVAVHTTQSSCDALDISGFRFFAVKPPTGVTSLTFYGSQNLTDTNFVLLDSIGTNGVVTVTANVWTVLDYTKLIQFPYIQMKSAGATGNAVVVASS